MAGQTVPRPASEDTLAQAGRGRSNLSLTTATTYGSSIGIGVAHSLAGIGTVSLQNSLVDVQEG